MKNKMLKFKNDKEIHIDTQFCSICYTSLTDVNKDISTTKCSHLFCTTCIIKSMKFNNTCPLCRTELTSPNKKFCINFNKSKRIVQEELLYYQGYISDNLNYIIDFVEYHTKENTLTQSIKHKLHREINEVFENFGMGICLNINNTFGNMNVYNTNSVVEQPRSPLESPPPQVENQGGVRLPPIS